MTRAPAGAREPRSTVRPVARPRDTHEREAQRAADVVSAGNSVAGWSFSSLPTVAPIQREKSDKPKTEEEKLKEGAAAAAERALEIPQVKALKEQVLAHPAVKIAAGTAIVGGVTALGVAGKPLPVQIPAIPLDAITPGLSAQLIIEDRVDRPSAVSLSLSYEEQGPEDKKKAPNAIAADIARLKAQQQMFKPVAQKAEEKRREQELVAAWLASQRLRIPVTPPPGPPAAPRKEEEAKTPVQPAPAGPGAAPPAHAQVDAALADPGRPLEPRARHRMEASFGQDFSTVRVHDDARAARAADSIDAAAFTVGQDIGFGAGRYDPNGQTGRRLLAHELAHVVQQTQGERSAEAQPLPSATRGGLERSFGRPLGHVRVHAGDRGQAIAQRHAAIAVAEGSDIYFSRGAYAPATARGARILRHEVAHVLQSEAVGGERPWDAGALEAEAELAAIRPGRAEIRGRADRRRPLLMKTFVSTVSSAGYLEMAVKFYKLWENETAIRIGSYQDIVRELAQEPSVLEKFRIVAHGSGASLFLPLLAKGKEYASDKMLGLQTQEGLAVELGRRGHVMPDTTAAVHRTVASDPAAKPLLTRVGLTAEPTGMLQEFLWWVSDEYFARNAKNAKTGKPANAADRAALAAKVTAAQKALKGLAAAKLPATAAATDLDELRTRWLDALRTSGMTWDVESGVLKEQQRRLSAPDAVAALREVKAGTFEGQLKRVKKRVNQKTHIEIRGCNVGRNDAYLNAIRAFFGSKGALPSVSAPMLYQFFGRPGALLLQEGGKAPPLTTALKALFAETLDARSTAAEVQAALGKSGLLSVPQLVKALRYADVKLDFERWWQMKRAGGSATAPIKSATLKDFEDFLLTKPKTFPLNAPGAGKTSVFYLILIPSSAIATLIAWVKDQGYSLPGGEDMVKRFAGGPTNWDPKRFRKASQEILVDWLGDEYPVPKQIYFPEDPVYKKNIRRLP